MDFYAFDFETANANRHSACSIALVKVKNKKIIDTYSTLINPECDFFWRNSQIHGIHQKDVSSAPTFPVVWQEIKHLFQSNHLFVAHNAHFDCSVLAKSLAHYGIKQPSYLSLCTVQTSKKLLPKLENYKLPTICNHLSIDLLTHHDALTDSLACAEILLKQQQMKNSDLLKTLVKPV